MFDEGTPTVLRLVDRDAARVGEEVHRLLNELRDTLEGGINQGEGIAELVDRIRTRVSPARSERIARTEAIAATNSGTVEGYRQAGIEQHEWLSSRDAFVRDSHNGLDGQVVNVGAPFEIKEGPNAGATILFPGDPAAPVGEIVNCRCTVMPVLGAP